MEITTSLTVVFSEQESDSGMPVPHVTGGGDVGEHDAGAAHVRRDEGSRHHRASAEQDTEET